MGHNRGGFYDDDYDDDRETNFGAQQGGGFSPAPNFGAQQYDPAEADTRFYDNPHQLGGGGFNPVADTPTQMPRSAGGGGGGFSQDSGHTMLGEDDIEIKPIGFLIVKRPLPQRGYVHKLGDVNTVGREQGNVRLSADRRVSSIHARIRLGTDDEGEPIFVLKDMDSSTGTRVNDPKKRIDGSHRLKPGDEIYIGDHVFVFMMMMD